MRCSFTGTGAGKVLNLVLRIFTRYSKPTRSMFSLLSFILHCDAQRFYHQILQSRMQSKFFRISGFQTLHIHPCTWKYEGQGLKGNKWSYMRGGLSSGCFIGSTAGTCAGKWLQTLPFTPTMGEPQRVLAEEHSKTAEPDNLAWLANI